MFNIYPYLNENDLNLDYVLMKMKALIETMANFEHDEKFKIADPILFNIASSYERGTIVLDISGNAYLSLKATSGHALSDDEYWQEIFDFALYVRTANSNLTLHIEEGTERATAAYAIDDWLLWNDVLYKVTAAISVDDALVIGTNLERFTVEQFCRAWVTYGTNLINQYKYDIDESERQYVADMQAEIDRILAGATVDSEVIDARLGADGVNYTTLGNAIRSQMLLTYFNRKKLPQGSDLNDINENSTYQIGQGSSNIPANYPSELGTNGGVVVTNIWNTYNNNAYKTQYLIGYDRYYVFARTMNNGTWGAWSRINITPTELAKYYKNYGLLAAGSDLNDITINSVYQVGSNTPSHYPTEMGSGSGVVLTNVFSGTNFLTQYIIAFSTGKIFARSCSNGTWSDWLYLNDYSKFYENYGTIPISYNLDNITENCVYQITSGRIPTNYPTKMGNDAGIVITNKFSGVQFMTQYVIGFSNGMIYIRHKSNGTWNDWIPISAHRAGRTVKIFGDSVAYGYSADHDHDQSPYNIVQFVGDYLQLEAQNHAVPAQGLISDWSDVISLIDSTSFTNCSLCIVNWAYNDSGIYNTINFGSPSDPTPTGTPTTYLGYYAYILNKIQKKMNYGLVVLVTGYGAPPNQQPSYSDQFTRQYTFADGAKTVKQMYDALEEMCHLKGFNCVNQAKGSAINQSNYNPVIGDTIHPTYEGYRIYSNIIAAKVASIFNNM